MMTLIISVLCVTLASCYITYAYMTKMFQRSSSTGSPQPVGRSAISGYVAVHYRANDIPRYFGPFTTLDDLLEWSIQANLPAISYVPVYDPTLWLALDYEDRWLYEF